MALIGKIRKHIWIVVVLIALGLAGFVIQDMISGQQSIFGSQELFVGKVNGEKIQWSDFSRTEQLLQDFLYRNSQVDPYLIRTSLWNFLVEKSIVESEAEALGLGVSRQELIDLQFGDKLSPVISQRFQDQQTRQVNREQLNAIKEQIEKNTMDPTFKVFWAHQEKEVVKDRLQSKIANMVAKAIYTPTWMVESMSKEQNERLDLAYVRVPFDDVDNTEVALSDADFEAYFKENQYKYKQDEETRKVQYLNFNVKATAKDSADIKRSIEERMQPFAETENDTLFVENNFGRIEPTFLSKEELSAAIADTIFKLPVGTVYGPYLDQDAYTCVKLLETATMADSADTRHILIQASTPEDLVKAESRIDSMKTVLEQGAANFDSLAIKFSQDGGSASKGGKYEGITPNTFVPEYNSVLFITGEIGKLYKVKTSFGWHLIEVLKRYGNSKSRARVAYISQPMVPSEETQKAVYNEVYQLVQKSKTIDDLKKVADSRNDLDLTTSPQLKRNDFVLGELGSGQASRDIIRWAFGDDQRLGRSKVGAISPEIYTYRSADNSYDNKYVLAALKSITPKGTPNWKDLREELEPLVINRKKAEIIKAKISGQDLPAIANSFQLKVDTAQGATFGNAFIPGLGAEPRLIGKAFSMEPNAVSAPMEGMAGVYIFKILNKVPAPQAQNAPGVREQLAASTRSSLQGRLLETMTKQANISDSRSRFY